MELSSNNGQQEYQSGTPFYFELDDDQRRGRENGWAEADLCASINRGRNLVHLTRYTSGDREYLEHPRPRELSGEEQLFGFPAALADIFQAAAYAGADVEELINRALKAREQHWAEAVTELEISFSAAEVGEPLPAEWLTALKARLREEPSAEDPGEPED